MLPALRFARPVVQTSSDSCGRPQRASSVRVALSRVRPPAPCAPGTHLSSKPAPSRQKAFGLPARTASQPLRDQRACSLGTQRRALCLAYRVHPAAGSCTAPTSTSSPSGNSGGCSMTTCHPGPTRGPCCYPRLRTNTLQWMRASRHNQVHARADTDTHTHTHTHTHTEALQRPSANNVLIPMENMCACVCVCVLVLSMISAGNRLMCLFVCLCVCPCLSCHES